MSSQGQASQADQTQKQETSGVVFLSRANGQIKVEPSAQEQDQLQNLLDWRKKSEKTPWTLGTPISY